MERRHLWLGICQEACCSWRCRCIGIYGRGTFLWISRGELPIGYHGKGSDAYRRELQGRTDSAIGDIGRRGPVGLRGVDLGVGLMRRVDGVAGCSSCCLW